MLKIDFFMFSFSLMLIGLNGKIQSIHCQMHQSLRVDSFPQNGKLKRQVISYYIDLISFRK